MAEIKAYFDAATSTVTYLVWDEATRTAAIIDPVLDFEIKTARIRTNSIDAVLADADALGLIILYALDTHAHADHLTATDYIRTKTGAKVGIGALITDTQRTFAPLFNATDVKGDGAQFDLLLSEGDTLPLGERVIRVLHTPGHTSACITYQIDDAVFVGDLMFMPDYGTPRTDFPGGDATKLYHSIRRLLDLPPETRIFIGHDYLPASGRDVIAWETSVADQRANNVHIHDGVAEADFVVFRKNRDLPLAPPVLILPSLQVNIRGGKLPPADANGTAYLKLPVNKIGKP